MLPRPAKSIANLLLVAACSLAGCSQPTAEELDPDNPNTVSEFGKLTKTRLSHNQYLQKELARLEAVGDTPEHLTTGPSWQTDAKSATSPEQRLLTLLPQGGAPILLKQLQQFFPEEQAGKFPSGPFELKDELLKKAVNFGEKYHHQRRSIREILDSGNLDLRIQYTEGLLASFDFLDIFRVGIRLEMIDVAHQLANNDTKEAIQSLGYALKMVEQMSRQGHMIPRMEAVHQRRVVLRALEAVAVHPRADRGSYESLAELLDHQLKRWPADRQAWIAERAQGLHTYEVVRNGHFQSLLTEDELAEYEENDVLKTLSILVMRNIDEDEKFYLEAMRKVVEACDDPFYTRHAVLLDIEDQLKIVRDTGDRPRVADIMLLDNLSVGHRLQAEDRARMLGWSLALRLATGADVAIPQSPVTGKPYVADRSEQEVQVSQYLYPDYDRVIAIPLRGS